jgi:hypothetical protein
MGKKDSDLGDAPLYQERRFLRVAEDCGDAAARQGRPYPQSRRLDAARSGQEECCCRRGISRKALWCHTPDDASLCDLLYVKALESLAACLLKLP